MVGMQLKQVAGGPIASSIVLFSHDVKHIFSISGCSIRMFSLETAQQLRKLTHGRHECTMIRINPANPRQLYASYVDGTIRLWDYTDAVIVRTIKLGKTIQNFMFLSTQPSKMYWLSSKKTGAEFRCFNLSLNNEDGADDEKKSVIDIIFHTSVRNNWTADPKGKFIVGTQVEKLVAFWPATGASISHSHTGKITCIAPHPTEDIVAVGDTKGRVTLYYQFSSDTPVTSVFHWHAHAVQGLAYNSDGTYLMSGGEEAVLAILQVETGTYRFLPRLGAPFTGLYVSPDDSIYTGVHADNTIRVMDALAFEVMAEIRGVSSTIHVFGNAKAVTEKPKADMQIEPRRGLAVINGGMGSIQFYDIKRDAVSVDHQVVDRMYVSRTENKGNIEIVVEKICFTKNGGWMATVEYRDDKEFAKDVRVKFWEWLPDIGRYSINTSIEPAHGDRITSMVAHPTDLVVITTGLDNVFKAWGFVPDSGANARGSWQCLYVRSYNDLPMLTSAMSLDGSLLAVAAGHFITLWNPQTCELAQALASPGRQPSRGLGFTTSAFLVSHSDEYVTVWNLLSCSVWWRIKLDVDFITIDPYESRFFFDRHQTRRRHPTLHTSHSKLV